MHVMAGHRTGVFEGLLLSEWQLRRREDDGSIHIQRAGGKNRRYTGATTVVLEADLDLLLALYVERARPLLRTAARSEVLFPGLQPHGLHGVEHVFRLRPGEFRRLLGGHVGRQWHASVTLDLERRGLLTADQSRRAANYRRHSLAVAERVYDRRNQALHHVEVQHQVQH